ncbi:hypothetical protein BS78_10G154000 [Paspalum vaginatum]|nr:hypothetical protein BS78_10G154000 [Paspalum vaginatum]
MTTSRLIFTGGKAGTPLGIPRHLLSEEEVTAFQPKRESRRVEAVTVAPAPPKHCRHRNLHWGHNQVGEPHLPSSLRTRKAQADEAMAPQINSTKYLCADFQFDVFPFDEKYIKNNAFCTHAGLSSKIYFGAAKQSSNIYFESIGNQQRHGGKQGERPSQVGGPIHLGVGHLGL